MLPMTRGFAACAEMTIVTFPPFSDCRDPFLTATLTAIHRHQLALLDIKLLLFAHGPFVMAVLAQAFGRGFFLLECEDIRHKKTPLNARHSRVSGNPERE